MTPRLKPAVLLAAAALVFGLVATPGVVAQRPAAPPSGPVNPSLLTDLYYRPLTVFSRGGRVTAVAGVPSALRAMIETSSNGSGLSRSVSTARRAVIGSSNKPIIVFI